MNAAPLFRPVGTPSLPRRPDTRVYRDVPVTTWTDWNVQDVRDALSSHVVGNFSRSAQLSDAALADDRVHSVVTTRVLGLLGLPFEITPSEDAHAAKARKVARELEPFWWESCPESQIAEFLRWAVMLGFALAEIVWIYRRGFWRPTLRTWHPQLVYYRLDTRRYVVFTQDGPVEITPGDGKWILYAPHGEYRGWLSGSVRSVAIPWLLRQYAHRDWARYSEIHGMPIRGCKVPATASEADKESFYRQIAGLGVETTVQLPQGMDGQSFEIELIEASAGHWQAFERLISKCDVNIACAVLGQNLTTEVQGGSFAAASAHGQVRQDYLEADAETLATTLRAQLLRPWAAFNFGDPELAPWPRWDTTPPEDKSQNAATLQAFADAVSKLTALGVPVDLPALADQYQIPLRSVDAPLALGPVDANAYLYGIVTVNEARARLHLPPIDGGDSPAKAPDAGIGMAEKVHLSKTNRTGLVNGQLYADHLTDHTARHAATLLRSNAAAVLEAIERGESFAEVRRHLKATFEDMHPGALADLTENALIMARAAGHNSMHEDST